LALVVVAFSVSVAVVLVVVVVLLFATCCLHGTKTVMTPVSKSNYFTIGAASTTSLIDTHTQQAHTQHTGSLCLF